MPFCTSIGTYETRCLRETDRHVRLSLFQADASDVQQAYRRLTLIYHPDKHTDLRRKQLAMEIFIQVKKAYDILADPQKRAIYDVLGMKGLQAEGGEVRVEHRC